mgnify:CR=1 FL=1
MDLLDTFSEEQKILLSKIDPCTLTPEKAWQVLKSLNIPEHEWQTMKMLLTIKPKSKKIPVNEPCICGSKIKYKKCCGKIGKPI